MKKGIHPKYNKKVTVTCACGNTLTTGSTLESITVEVCSKCHPFYTGEERFVDTEGRVDKFNRKKQIAEKERKKRIKALKKKIERQKARETAAKSLKEMMKSL